MKKRITDFLRSITPTFLLEWNRNRKKRVRNNQLLSEKENGNIISKENLIEDLKKCSIVNGDVVLVHSSLSKIGYLENGSTDFIEALRHCVGETGTICMPSSPNAELQLNFIKKNLVFDVKETPSKLGAITESFRRMPNVIRSLNATEPVCAQGPQAKYITEGHFGEITPYSKNSPFGRIAELKGKILYVGVTLDNAGTSLHLLEDEIENFPLPVYFPEVFSVKIKDENGTEYLVKTKVHNPEQSAKRKCDLLLPLFEKEGAAFKSQIGKATTWVFSADKMLDSMLKNFRENGTTMYSLKENYSSRKE